MTEEKKTMIGVSAFKADGDEGSVGERLAAKRKALDLKTRPMQAISDLDWDLDDSDDEDSDGGGGWGMPSAAPAADTPVAEEPPSSSTVMLSQDKNCRDR